MANDSVRMIATMKAREGKSDELRSVLEELVEASRGEEGCLQYVLLENAEDSSEFTFIEEWRDDAALAAHAQSEHFKSGSARLKELLGARPELRRYRLVK
jgi:quinol monooxygenase YgiN